MLQCLIMTATGFLSGSVMFSYYIPKWFFGVDVRKNAGDHNPGSTNAIHSAGPVVGILCMALDVLKGFIPIFVAVDMMNISGAYLVPVIAAPCLGHAFSPFLGFHGGKAVAVSYGTLLGLLGISRAVFLVALTMAVFKFILVIRPDSAKTIASFAISGVGVLLFEPLPEVKIAVCIIGCVVCFKHFLYPDKGGVSVSVWHYSVAYEDYKIKFRRV
ncbi:MAG: glycerol-3-phosphate acyltransferase [Acetanaerobacterium sp.]